MEPKPTFDLPAPMSTFAADVDWLYYFIMIVSAVMFFGIVITMLYFVWRYRRTPGHKSEVSGDHTVLEIAWTFAPLILLGFLFHWGFQGYVASAVAPSDALEIRVYGRQWNWTFGYPNGALIPEQLVVPVGRPIKLIMSSEDVLHSLFVPAFRIKKDVVPGMFSTLWFQATHETSREGAVDPQIGHAHLNVFCAEYCGLDHSRMLAKAYIVSQAEYDAFLERSFERPADLLTDEAWGEKLFSQSGCTACHHTDATANPGPSFKGLFGREERFEDGSTVVVDENYLRESILRPQAKIVRGFNNVQMPSIRLHERQVNALVAWIKTVR